MANELISVLLPNFNGSAHLKETIESVLCQTYENLELIVIDDGSTDSSPQIIRSMREKDGRVRPVFLDKNRHICYALNRGLKEAKGRFIARIDCGDQFYPDKLALQMEYLLQHPECGACFTLVDLIDGKGTVINDKEKIVYQRYQQPNRTQTQWLYYFIHCGNCLAHPSVVFPKSIIDRVGPYDMAMMQGEDFDLWMRIALEAPLHIIEKPLLACLWDTGNPDKISDEAKDSNMTRFFNIRVEAVEKLFDHIIDQQLIRFFQQEFRNSGSSSPLELECEKGFLLLNCFQDCPYFHYLGFKRLARVVNQPGGVELLEDKFGFSLHDLYALNMEHMYFDSVAFNDQAQKNQELASLKRQLEDQARQRQHEAALRTNENALLQNTIIAKNHELAAIRESTSWRVTAPIRKLRSRSPERRPVIYFVPSSDYGNLGDHKIMMEIRHFFRCYFPKFEVREISCRHYEEKRQELLCQVQNGDILAAPGGGSIGDVYLPYGEKYMRDMIQCFPNNQIIIFPQSLFYTKSELGEAERKNTAAIFDSHPDLTLALRDQNAYQEAKKMFRRTKLMLIPDIVLFSDPYLTKAPRSETGLLMIRSDGETSHPQGWNQELEEICGKYAKKIISTDTQKNYFIDLENRETEVNAVLEQISASKFLVTDRLHGMIFAAITSTPCVAFDNVYGKVFAQYQWIRDLPYLEIAESPEQLSDKLDRVLKAQTPVYTRKPLEDKYSELANAFRV